MIQKEITDPKTLYLVKTLSRTKRKDYENYVINAIWQRLNNNDIEVVSQQYVENTINTEGRSHYFIDLYFPTLNIGIECDEAFHKKQSKSDQEREASIYDIINKIKKDNYFPIHIDVTQNYEDLQKCINDAVKIIKQKITEINPPKWEIKTPEEYYSSKNTIHISDKKGFNSINKTCNVLFNAGRNEETKGASRAYFSLPIFKGTVLNGYKIWFPHLAVEVIGKDGKGKTVAATKTGWNNQLSDDGKTIIEYNENNKTYKQDGKKRIVFLKYKDPLGYNEYKFVGVFGFGKKIDNNTISFKKISDDCVIRKGVK
jgi:very-short-patch-repair endonuclease